MKRSRLTREMNQARILDKTIELFRHFGPNKTTIADIAGALNMSSANVYKFFPSKNALMEAVAQRDLRELQAALLVIAQSNQSMSERLVLIAMKIFNFHQEFFQMEKNVYNIVILAAEERWACVSEFKEFTAKLIEDLISEGIRRGEFKKTDAAERAQIFVDSLTWILNPLLFPELDSERVLARLRTHITFLTAALK